MASSKGIAKYAVATLGCAGAAVAAPFLAPYLATLSLPFIATVLSDVLKADKFGEKLGLAIADTTTGLLTEFGASAAQQIPSALSSGHNFHLERMLGQAYLESLNAIEASTAVTNDDALNKQVKAIVPLLKARLHRGLKAKELFILFPLGTKEQPLTKAFAGRFSAESIQLMMADEFRWREELGNEVEIALRRWLNEEHAAAERGSGKSTLGLSSEHQLPEPLRSHLQKELPGRISHRISELVKDEDFGKSWIAFQRAHLQGMLRVVEGIETAQADVRASIDALSQRIQQFSSQDTLVEKLSEQLREYLTETTLSRETMDALFDRQGREMLAAIGEQLSRYTEKISGEITQIPVAVVDELERRRFIRTSDRPFQLPKRAQAGEFFGRKQLLDELTKRLRNREDVCVWGPAGMGKTALAAEAVRAIVGEDEDLIANSLFPDGVVLLDLYQSKANVEKVWDHLAASFAPEMTTDKPARDRAEGACRGRRALIVVEGAEEAHGGDGLQMLLGVLAPENRRLILTRNKSQATGRPLYLERELSREDGVALLRKITADKVAADVLDGVCERLGGHPLALTCAGSQLEIAAEAPQAFLRELQDAALPRLHEPGYEHRTLNWLYGRSVRHLTADAGRIMTAAGMLAAASFPLSAAVVTLTERNGSPRLEEQSAREALRLLVRHGLFRLSDSHDEGWEFTHALAYQFARGGQADTDLLRTLGQWARLEINDAVVAARNTGDFSRLRLVVSHSASLMRSDNSSVQSQLADALLYDGHTAFLRVGRLDLAASSIQTVEQWMDGQHAEERNSPPWQRERSIVWHQKGGIQQAQGDLAGARVSYEQYLKIAQRLAASDPGNAEWQRDLSISYNKLGGIQQAEGDLAGARVSYEQSQKIRQKLVASDPSNAQWQRDLSISCNSLGGIQQAQGDLAGARVSYEQYLKIAQKLAASDPSNAEWQRDLSISCNSLGGIQQAQGDLAGARVSYEQYLKIAQKLAASDPSNAEWQRDLSISYENLGGIQRAEGDLAGARVSYEQSQKIAQRLAASDPSNAEWQRDLSISYENLGGIQRAEGDLAGARVSYEQSQKIRQKLAASDPSNAQWQRDLSISYENLGGIQQAQGDLAGARVSYEQSQKIRQKLAGSDPSNAQWQRDLSISYEKLGGIQQAQGDLAGARVSYEQSQKIRQKLAGSDPSNAQWQRDLSISYEKLGGVQQAQGDLAGARVSYEQSQKIRQKLAGSDPSNVEWQRDLSISYENLGGIQQAQGDLAGARVSYEQSQKIAQKLAASDPGNAQWQRDLSISYNKLGGIQQAEGDLAGARVSYEQSQKIRQKLAANDPSNAEWQRDLSISYEKLGGVQQVQGDLAGARVSYEQSQKIRQKLAANDPSNAEWQRDLSISYEKLGGVQQVQGDLAGARVSYGQSQKIRQKSAASDPSNVEWQRDLSISYEKLGGIQQAQRDLAGARVSFEQTQKIAQKLAASDPSNVEWQRDLSVGYNKLGGIQQAEGDLAGARVSYEQSQKIAQKLAGSDPSNAQWQRDLSISYNNLGGIQQAQGDLAGARVSYGQDLKIAQKLAASDPSNAEWQRDLSISYNELGGIQQAEGDLAGARVSYEQTQKIAQKLAGSDPSNAQWQRDLQWVRKRLAQLK